MHISTLEYDMMKSYNIPLEIMTYILLLNLLSNILFLNIKSIYIL